MQWDKEFFGYGLSPRGRQADWEELEADLPVRGLDCPYAAELIALALNQCPAETRPTLESHVKECAYCSARFVRQQRAVAQAAELSAAAPPGESFRDAVAASLQYPGSRRARRSRRRGAGPEKESKIILWDLETGQSQTCEMDLSAEVTCTAFSPDGRVLAVGDLEGTLHLWEVAGGRLWVDTERHDGAVRCLTFSPDGRLLATAGDDLVVLIRDARTGERHGSYEHPARIRSVLFSLDGAWLASVDAGGTTQVWDVAACELRNILELPLHGRHRLAFSPDGRLLVALRAPRKRQRTIPLAAGWLQGGLQTLDHAAGDEDTENFDVVQRALLKLPPGRLGIPELKVALLWKQKGAESWSVTVRLPSQKNDSAFGNPEPELKEFDRRLVRLRLNKAPNSTACEVLTPLLWDLHKQELATFPETVKIDAPATLKFIKLYPLERIQRPDAK